MSMSRQELEDRYEGVSAELAQALGVLWRHGDPEARTWVFINYPGWARTAAIYGTFSGEPCIKFAQRDADESTPQPPLRDQPPESAGGLVEDAEKIIDFGTGSYAVDTGYSHGRPAVFIEPVTERGEPNTYVPDELQQPLNKLRPGSVAITFPKMEQAEAAANLFCGGSPPDRILTPEPASILASEDDGAGRRVKVCTECGYNKDFMRGTDENGSMVVICPGCGRTENVEAIVGGLIAKWAAEDGAASTDQVRNHSATASTEGERVNQTDQPNPLQVGEAAQ